MPQTCNDGGLIFSTDGFCRPFDKNRTGTVLSNGGGAVCVKRLTSAINDGDHVYATILNIHINNDGKEKAGFTTPSIHGQQRVIEDCINSCNTNEVTRFLGATFSMGMISLLEAHATGTIIGDQVEVQALSKVFHSVTTPNQCLLTSVKKAVGHLNTASGIAGLIRCALCLDSGLFPSDISLPNSGGEDANLNLTKTCFHTTPRSNRWNQNEVRVCGVSSFGLGGTNAHALLAVECHHKPAMIPHNNLTNLSVASSSHTSLFLLSAQTETSLHLYSRVLWDHSQKLSAQAQFLSLDDIAYTLAMHRPHYRNRYSFLCNSLGDLTDTLHRLADVQPTVADDSTLAMYFHECTCARTFPVSLIANLSPTQNSIIGKLLSLLPSHVGQHIATVCTIFWLLKESLMLNETPIEIKRDACSPQSIVIAFLLSNSTASLPPNQSALIPRNITFEGKEFSSDLLLSSWEQLMNSGTKTPFSSSILFQNGTKQLDLFDVKTPTFPTVFAHVIGVAGKLWENGVAVNWKTLMDIVFPPTKHNILSLPTYQYDREDLTSPVSVGTSKFQLHPASLPLISEHKLFGINIAPATYFIASILSETPVRCISSFHVHKALLVESGTPIDVNFTENGKKCTFSIHGSASTAELTPLYCSGDISSKVPVKIPKIKDSELSSTTPEDAHPFYSLLEKQGFQYGKAFQLVQQVLILRKTKWNILIMTRVKMEEDTNHIQVEQVTRTLDACLQGCAFGALLLLPTSSAKKWWVPFHISYFEVSSLLDGPLTLDVIVKLKSPYGSDSNTLVGKIFAKRCEPKSDMRASLLPFSEGTMDLVVKGLKMHLVSPEVIMSDLTTASPQDVRSFLYQCCWKQSKKREIPLSHTSRGITAVVLTMRHQNPGLQWANTYSIHLKSLGGWTSCLSSSASYITSSTSHTLKNLRSSVPLLVVIANFEETDAQSSDCTVLSSKLYETVSVLQTFCQRTTRVGLKSCVQLVTFGAFYIPVTGNYPPSPLYAALVAIVKSLCLEDPNLVVSVVDLACPSSIDNDVVNTMAHEALKSMKRLSSLGGGSYSIISFRQHQRYIPQIEPLSITCRSPHDLKNKDVLITGSSGAIPQLITSWCKSNSANTVWGFSRTKLSSPNQLQVDISESKSTVEALQQVFSASSSLNTLFHCAAVAGNAKFEFISQQLIEHTLRPKLGGAVSLLGALRSTVSATNPCVISIFSSLSALYGAPGQACYAAANAAMEAFVTGVCLSDFRHHVMVVQWPQWHGMGLSRNTLTNSLSAIFPVHSCLRALSHLLQNAHSLPGVVTVVNPSPTSGDVTKTSFKVVASTVYKPLPTLDSNVRYLHAGQIVQAALKSTIGVELSAIDTNAPLAKIGLFDSLVSIQLHNILSTCNKNIQITPSTILELSVSELIDAVASGVSSGDVSMPIKTFDASIKPSSPLLSPIHSKSVVVIRQGSTASNIPPLFVIAPWATHGKWYREMLPHIPDNQPLIALHHPCMEDMLLGNEIHSLPELVSIYCTIILSISQHEPPSPVYILGLSYSCLVAIMAASELYEKGYRVELILLDPIKPPNPGMPIFSSDRDVTEMFLIFYAFVMCRKPYHELVHLLNDSITKTALEEPEPTDACQNPNCWKHFFRLCGLDSVDMTYVSKEVNCAIVENKLTASFDHSTFFRGHTIVVLASEADPLQITTPGAIPEQRTGIPTMGLWLSMLGGEVTCSRAPGNHFTIMDAPQLHHVMISVFKNLPQQKP
ncbi:hybrid non-ribosomal peptide synthetase/type I polyketide synthase [Pelomyxa schiedti]|nr:hybrid non-ribosomal peptide synthetase/type I polyketide synthase [Pelomyxa schiedti]